MSLILMGRRRGALSVQGGALGLILGGSAQALSYAEPLGQYPDGSARTLFVQFSRTMTNGTPVTGTLTVANRTIDVAAHRWASGSGSTLCSIGVPLREGDIPSGAFGSHTTGSYTDDSATWTNAAGASWATQGIPAGVVVPTSATHLCAASSFGALTPQSGQPSFTGSAAYDTALTDTYTSTVLAFTSTFYTAASYDRAIALYHLFCRTANADYLRASLAHAAVIRTSYWAPNSFEVPEQYRAHMTWLMLYLLRRDTTAMTGFTKAASFVGIPVWENFIHDINGRNAGHSFRSLACALKAGLGSTIDIYGVQTYGQTAAIQLGKVLEQGADKLVKSNFRVAVPVYAEDQVTIVDANYPYMAALLVDALVDFCSVMPPSTNRTNVLSMCSSIIEYIRLNFQVTSGTGTASLFYSDTDAWDAPFSGTLAANYTSGSTSIQVSVPARANSAIGAFTTVKIGSTVRRTNGTPVTLNGSGVGTLTLQSGFPSGASSGATISLADNLALANGGSEVDLNGFFPHLFAWRAAYANSLTDANLARTFLATISFTPRDGTTGPSIGSQKQWDEAFFRSQSTFAYLAQAGI